MKTIHSRGRVTRNGIYMSSCKDCIFCNLDPARVVAENDLAYVVRDGYPVTSYHSLIIPKRHVQDYFCLQQEEILQVHKLLQMTSNEILRLDQTVEGFNIGMNCGECAGQTIFHCHVHLIPRRKGDVDFPRGGVRHLIPGKGNY